MRTIGAYLAIATYMSASVAGAECIYPVPRFLQMKIESCTSAIEPTLSKIGERGHTESEVSSVRLSAADISIVRARPVADLDIILWYSQGDQRIYKANETRIANGSARDYILLATGLDECEKSYLGKILVFDTKGFTRCRDVRVDGYKETDAAYILDLPVLVHFWGEEQLEHIPEKLPSPGR